MIKLEIQFTTIYQCILYYKFRLITNLLTKMKLTQNDLCGIDSSCKNNNRFNRATKDDEQEQDEETNNEGSDYYNPNFTLRKCASKIIDNLSNLFPNELYENIKQLLDSGLQNPDWFTK